MIKTKINIRKSNIIIKTKNYKGENDRMIKSRNHIMKDRKRKRKNIKLKQKNNIREGDRRNNQRITYSERQKEKLIER